MKRDHLLLFYSSLSPAHHIYIYFVDSMAHSCISYMYINLPPLVLNARLLSDPAFSTGFSRLNVPEQALNGIPLDHGIRAVY